MKKINYEIALSKDGKKTKETVKGYLFDKKTAMREERVFYPFIGWKERFIFDDLRTGYRVATIFEKKTYKEAIECYKKDYKKSRIRFQKGGKIQRNRKKFKKMRRSDQLLFFVFLAIFRG